MLNYLLPSSSYQGSPSPSSEPLTPNFFAFDSGLPVCDMPRIAGHVSSSAGGVLAETFFYGVFLTLLIRSTTILRRCRTEEAAKMTRRMNTILLFVSVILFTLATAQWALNCSMLFEALDFSGGALLYYLMPAHPKLVAQIAITICECIIADLFVCYRLYIIWGRNKWVTCFPILCCLGMLVADVILCLEVSGKRVGGSSATIPGTYTAFIGSVASNIYSTAMIAFKVYREDRHVRNLGLEHGEHNSTRHALRIIVESAALYTYSCIYPQVTSNKCGRSNDDTHYRDIFLLDYRQGRRANKTSSTLLTENRKYAGRACRLTQLGTPYIN